MGRSEVGTGVGYRYIILFLSSQVLSCLGGAMRAVAVTILLYKITGSGLSTGLSLLYSIIPGILLSPYAGSIGDILPEKHVLIALEIMRSITAAFFASADNAAAICILLILLSSFDAVYNPSLRKITVGIMGKGGILAGNSLLIGIFGTANVFGSILAGILAGFHEIKTIIIIDALFHALSALLLAFVHVRMASSEPEHHMKQISNGLHARIKHSISCLRRIKPAGEIITASAVLSFVSISINMAFYPFAFDVLKATNKEWSMIMSIFYITNITAMAIAIFSAGKGRKHGMLYIHALLFIASICWFLYSMLDNLLFILLLQLIEGTALSLCTIFLISRLQLAVRKDFLAGAAGIADFVNNVCKITGIGFTYFIIKSFSTRHVFIFNSFLVISYILYKSLSTGTAYYSTRMPDRSCR